MKNIYKLSAMMLFLTVVSVLSLSVSGMARSAEEDNNSQENNPQGEVATTLSLIDQDKPQVIPLYPLAEIPDFKELLTRKTPLSAQEFKADKEIKWDRLKFSLDLIENAYVKNNLNVAYARGSINVKYHQEQQETTKELINVIDTVKLNQGVRFQTEKILGSGENGIWSVADHKIHLSGKNTTIQVIANNLTIISQKYFDYNTVTGVLKAIGNVRAVSDGRTVQAHELNTSISPIEVLKTGKLESSSSDDQQDISKIDINEIHALGNVKINTDAQQVTGHQATFNIKTNMVKVDGQAKIIRYPSLEELQTYKNRKDKTKGTKPENRIITADHIVGYLTKNNDGKSPQGIKKVTATGHVKYTNATQTVIGSRALYDPKKSEAFIYDVIAYRDGDSLKACMAHVDLKTTLTEVGPCDRVYGKKQKSHSFNRKLRKKGKKVDSKEQVVIDLTVDPEHTKVLNKSLHKQLPLPNFEID